MSLITQFRMISFFYFTVSDIIPVPLSCQTFKGFVFGDPPKSVNVRADGRWFVMSCRNGKAHVSDINRGLIQKIYDQTICVAQTSENGHLSPRNVIGEADVADRVLTRQRAVCSAETISCAEIMC